MFAALAVFCIGAEARTSMRRAPNSRQVSAVQAHISPKLEPESSDKFFKKDYPADKRPKADPFHFHHPYPVVQDSSEYDADFIKDENSDNGNWKAQETYDRLRAKLAKEKRDLAKALQKKTQEEKDLEAARRRHQKEKQDADEARKKAEKIGKDHEKARKAESEEEKRRSEEKKRKESSGESAADKPAPKRKVIDVDGQTKKTQGAMDHLEDCKKELAKARAQLKDMMKELEAAKAAQNAANAELDEAMQKELSMREKHAMQKKEVKSEHDEYLAAKDAYLKQQALVEKMEADLKAAAAKVKAMRDSEDKHGGVYPTPDEPRKSVAIAAKGSLALFVMIVARLTVV